MPSTPAPSRGRSTGWGGTPRPSPAASSPRPPPRTHAPAPPPRPIPGSFFHRSTHAINVADAIELARSLGELPPHLVVYGIEGRSFEAGAGLSPEVEKAVQEVVEAVVGELRGMGLRAS